MKRSAFIQRKPKVKRPAPLVPKATGAAARGYKEPAKDQAHMARIAALGCLICGQPAHAHHVDIVLPKKLGPKVTDYATAPLCPDHHLNNKQDCAHGYGGEREFWARHRIDIAAWIVRTLTKWYPPGTNPKADAAIDAINTHRRAA